MALPYKVYPFPDEFAPPEEKARREWGVSSAKAIYSRYLNGYTLLVYGNQDWYALMSLYCQSDQPRDQYVAAYRGYGSFRTQGESGAVSTNNIGAGTPAAEFARKGLQNLSYEINSPIGPIISQIKALLNEADEMPDVSCENKDAKTKKEYLKWLLWAKSQFINPLKAKNGMPVDKLPWTPQSIPELELYEKYHGFKLGYEIGLQRAINHSLDISKWSEVLIDDFKDSAIQTSFICGRVVVNGQGAVEIEYIPSSNFITAYLPKQKMDTPPFAGHVYRRQIMEIEGALREQGATDADIMGLAKKHAGINGWNDPANYDFNYTDPATNRYLWYEWYVPVLHFETRSNDEERFRMYKNSSGKLNYVRENPVQDQKGRYHYRRNNNRNTENYDVMKDQWVYEGDWVIDSDYILNYGKQKNVIRNSDGSTGLSYFYYQVPGRSLAQRWKPILDQYQMAWLKMQANVLQARPDGHTIDVGILANIDLGFGEEMSPAELARVDIETGNLFVRTTEVMMRNRINASSAIVPRPGGPGEQMRSWVELRQYYLQELKNVSGVTDAVASAGGGSPELVGLMEGEIISTENALYEIKKALINIKQQGIEKVAAKVRVLLEFNPKSYEYYSGVIGENFVKEILLFKDVSINQSGIIMRPAPTRERKKVIMDMVAMSIAPNKSGQTLIDLDDAMYIEDLVNRGYIQAAAAHYTIAKYRKAQAEAEKSQAEQQMNAQVQIASSQAAEQAKAQTIQIKAQADTQGKLAEIQTKGQVDSLLQAQAHAETLEELDREAVLETNNEVNVSR